MADRLLRVIEHTPRGYAFLGGLPRKGRHSRSQLRKHLAQSIARTFFPTSVLSMLVRTCLLANGMPNPTAYALQDWLIAYYYAGSSRRLYDAWFHLPPASEEPLV